MKNQTNLGVNIAQNLLKRHFQKSLASRQNLDTIRLFCQESSMQNPNIKKTLMRILKQKIGSLIVDIILNDIDEKKRRMILFRYQKRLSVVDTALRLHTSSSQLNKWHVSICEQIYDYMQYHLSIKDIYSRTKIVNMLEILGQEITMIDTIDPERRFVDACYYDGINVRLEKYTALMQHLDAYVRHHQRGTHSEIIFQKICNPNIKVTTLAKRCAYSISQVSHQLHEYEEEVRPYVY